MKKIKFKNSKTKRFSKVKSLKYTSLMHGKRFKTKRPRGPIMKDDFIRDSKGRIRGSYIDGIFIPD